VAQGGRSPKARHDIYCISCITDIDNYNLVGVFCLCAQMLDKPAGGRERGAQDDKGKKVCFSMICF
jgi:hypothetical protein